MGVEMQVFLIPRSNSFRPDGEALASFVEKLRRDDWICDPTKPWFPTMTFETKRQHVHAATTGAYVATLADRKKRVKKDAAGYSSLPQADLSRWFTRQAASDLMIVWPVENQGEEPAPLRYPLNKPSPLSPKDTYYDISFWLARDYVYKTAEVIDPFDDERCSCGADLVYDPEGRNASLFFTRRIKTRCQDCGKNFDPSERVATVRDPWTNKASKVRGGATFRFALVVDCGKCWPPDETGFGMSEELRTLCESHFAQTFYEVVEVY